MYNGIGLQTARGTGTNGYVQTNLSSLLLSKKRVEYNSEADLKKLEAEINRAPNEELLQHQRKRQIEMKCTEFEILMEEKGFDEDEIEKKVSDYRKLLLSQLESGELNLDKELNTRDSHARAKASQMNRNRMRDALGLQKDYVAGSSMAKMNKSDVVGAALQAPPKLEEKDTMLATLKDMRKKEKEEKKANKRKRKQSSSSSSSSSSDSSESDSDDSDSSDSDSGSSSSSEDEKAKKKRKMKEKAKKMAKKVKAEVSDEEETSSRARVRGGERGDRGENRKRRSVERRDERRGEREADSTNRKAAGRERRPSPASDDIDRQRRDRRDESSPVHRRERSRGGERRERSPEDERRREVREQERSPEEERRRDQRSPRRRERSPDERRARDATRNESASPVAKRQRGRHDSESSPERRDRRRHKESDSDSGSPRKVKEEPRSECESDEDPSTNGRVRSMVSIVKK